MQAQVEFLGQLDQRGITARRNVGDNAAHGRFHVGRGLPLGGEKAVKPRGEIVCLGVETDRHGRSCRTNARPQGQWREPKRPSTLGVVNGADPRQPP